MRSLAWLVGAVVLLAIVGGIIVDIDHPIARLLALPDGRFLMPYFAVAGGVLVFAGIGFLIACLCRYSWLRFLRKEIRGKIVPRPY
jgi:ABC-type cobalamin transport system permease subunit